jgi:hypothetical protein
MSSLDSSWFATNSKLTTEVKITLRPTAGRPVFVSNPIWDPRQYFCYCQTVAGLLLWDAFSDEMMDLSFTIAAGPHHCSNFLVLLSRDSWPYFTVSDSRLLQPGGTGPRIYISRENGGPVIVPGTGFHFLRLLRIAGLQWRYWNLSPHVFFNFQMAGVFVTEPWHRPRRKQRFQ